MRGPSIAAQSRGVAAAARVDRRPSSRAEASDPCSGVFSGPGARRDLSPPAVRCSGGGGGGGAARSCSSPRTARRSRSGANGTVPGACPGGRVRQRDASRSRSTTRRSELAAGRRQSPLGSINITTTLTGSPRWARSRSRTIPRIRAGNHRRVVFTPTLPSNPARRVHAGSRRRRSTRSSLPAGAAQVVVDGRGEISPGRLHVLQHVRLSRPGRLRRHVHGSRAGSPVRPRHDSDHRRSRAGADRRLLDRERHGHDPRQRAARPERHRSRERAR